MFQLVFVCAIPEILQEEYEGFVFRVVCIPEIAGMRFVLGVCAIPEILQEEYEGFVCFSWCLCVLYLRFCRKNMKVLCVSAGVCVCYT